MATDSKFKTASQKFTLPFNKRLVVYLLILLSIFMALSLVFQYSRERKYRAELLNSDLILLNTQAESYLEDGGNIENFIKLFKPVGINSLRVTIMNEEGIVLSDNFSENIIEKSEKDFTDSVINISEYENHLDRPEIISAIKNGNGYTSRRLSSTTKEEYFYSASLIGDKIIRTAVPYNNSLKDMLKADSQLYVFMVIYAILILLIFYYIIIKLGLSASAEKEKEKKQIRKQLTQNIGHELKTPVSGIKGYLETIISVPDMPQEKKDAFIEKSYELSVRLTHILQDTSLITRMDEGKELIEFENLYLKEIIEESIYEAQDKLKEKGIQIETKLEDFTPIKGNYTLLHSIFTNLIENAIAYSGGDKIEITVDKITKFPYNDKNYYKVSVKDNGTGIDKEHLSKIFEDRKSVV